MNNDIQENYVSFEVARLLFTSGFNMITTKSKFRGKRGESGYINFYKYWVDWTLMHQKYPDVYKSEILLDETTTNSSKFSGMESYYLGEQRDIPYYHAPTTGIALDWIKENFGLYIVSIC